MQAQENLSKFNELTNVLSQMNDEKFAKIKEIDNLELTKKFLETRQNLLEQLKEEEQIHAELKINLRNIVVNEDLLKREGDVLFLQQSLKEIQSVIKDQLKVKNEREHISAQIVIDLDSMGQGWTEERINEFELSELEKKEIQEFY